MDWEGRLGCLRARLVTEGVAGLVVASRANMRYLTGFAGEGMLLVLPDRALVCTDGRYRVEATEVAAGVETSFPDTGYLSGIAEGLPGAGSGPVAFEADAMTHSAVLSLTDRAAGRALTVARQWVEQLRLRKDADEAAAMRRAARLADQALAAFLAGLQPGHTERQLALDLAMAMAEVGTEPSFNTIMASGESAARPHAVPGSRRLAAGEMLKIDTGGKWSGYCSDITRTYFIGDPTERFLEVYRLVLAAQEAALAAVRPGVTGREVDAAARTIIADGGYGDAFSHGLGHGVGLEVHEAPRVSSRSDDVLEPGMVVTIEPGVYLEGWGGVRIEDMVLVTDDGCEVLTGAEKPRY